MSLQFIFRKISSADTDILHMIELRKANVEDYLCCEVTNEDGITNTTWYSKEAVSYTHLDVYKRQIIMSVIVIFGSNIWVFQQETFSWFDFCTNYGTIPLFLILYGGYKKKHHTKIIPLTECDFKE